jgi:hypothetical protein
VSLTALNFSLLFTGFCGFISFVITVIIVLSLVMYRADGYYTDVEMQHQWFTIFLPTFIADVFIVPALLINIYEHCNRLVIQKAKRERAITYMEKHL